MVREDGELEFEQAFVFLRILNRSVVGYVEKDFAQFINITLDNGDWQTRK